MTASSEPRLPTEFTTPATAGLVVVLVTVIVLLALSSRRARKLLGGKGTKYVVDEDGANIVRRSTRSTKKPSRFEPTLRGQGESTPVKEVLATIEKISPRLVKTPTTDADTPAGKKGPGRPRKTPAKDGAAASPTSPMRTRRGPRTPK